MWKQFAQTLPGVVIENNTISVPEKNVDILLAPVLPTGRWYWHDRQRSAAAMGRQLFIVWEDMWREHEQAVMNYVIARANPTALDRVYARNLAVEVVDSSVCRPFYERFHVQGAPRPSENIALCLHGTIVAMMSFRPVSSIRGTKKSKAIYEMIRYATSRHVVGGASRLHTAFLRMHPDIDHIVSYVDKAMFTGGMYSKLGYTKTADVGSEYWVIENDRRRYKGRYQKKHLRERFGNWICEGRTEKQIRTLYGLHALYDCGKARFDFHRG